MKFRWMTAPPQPLLAQTLARASAITPLLAQCLINRGLVESAALDHFLEPRLKELADPFLLPDMDKAVTRLLLARERAESVVIFGDYDVDGVTSTTILLETLSRLGWTVHAYLPHRMEEGYGLSQEGVEQCLKKFPTRLVLAVDCGSTAVEPIDWLGQQGVEVIVLDHHQVSSPAPRALALVNPHAAERALDGHPTASIPKGTQSPPPETPTRFGELCSAGLAFKLAHALVKRGRQIQLPGAAELDVRSLLDLVALGTIADLVPLVGENRIVVAAGLERLTTTSRPGLIALKQISLTASPVGTYAVGFQLAPRLNSAGRLESADESLQLLLTQNEGQATTIARNLDAKNRDRQLIEQTIVQEATATLRTRFDPEQDWVIVEAQSHWHLGVVGIVASRVQQEFYRPTFILGGDGAQWRGSGRSIVGFDLAAALRECADLLEHHGGHAMAAGVTLINPQLDAFRARLNQIARRQLPPEALRPPLRLDAEVRLDEISLGSLAELDRLKPTGMGNPAAQFYASNLWQSRPLQRMGAEKQHLKLWVTQGGVTHEAVWWNGSQKTLPSGKFDLAFAPGVNEFNGRKAVQLKVLDWRPV